MRSRLELFSALLVFSGCSAEMIDHAPDATIGEQCPSDNRLSYENFGEPFFLAWCNGCHSSALEGDRRAGAPPGVDFDTIDRVREHLPKIRDRAAGEATTMPPAGGPPASTRKELEIWLACGAPSSGPAAIPQIGPPDGGQEGYDSGSIDAGSAAPLFGDYPSPITPNAVFCGPMTCDAVAGATCCIAPNAAPQCTAGGETCSVSLGCDGPEDCSGAVCCIAPGEGSLRTTCAASCGEGTIAACHRAEDCGGGICCKNGDSPFGRCATMESAQPGEQCDVP